MDEDALLQAWRGGDRLAGDRLFRRHVAAVQRFFANKISSTPTVEDLVQRTFLQCLERPGGFAGRSSFRAYLLGIARFVLFGYFRESRRHSVVTELGSVSVEALGHGVSTLVGRNEEQQLLLQALRRIPLEQQIALELYYFEDLSAADAAAVLELAEGTVRSRVRLGKDALRKTLAELAPGSALKSASDPSAPRPRPSSTTARRHPRAALAVPRATGRVRGALELPRLPPRHRALRALRVLPRVAAAQRRSLMLDRQGELWVSARLEPPSQWSGSR